MPHTYECPLRWADMDLLGHVNNVTYLDYVSEAREALFAEHPASGASVMRHQVEFLRPLVFHRQPVLVDTWVTSVGDDRLTLAQEVYDAEADARSVYVRVTTVLAHRVSEAERELLADLHGLAQVWRPVAEDARPTGAIHSLTVRRSDLGQDGRVRSGVFFEYVQEARIRYIMSLHTRGQQWSQHVIARTDMDYLAPLAYRREPYAVHSWVSHLGGRSFTIHSEVRDDEQVVARAAVVMVTFDLETQGTTEMAPEQRARLEQELAS